MIFDRHCQRMLHFGKGQAKVRSDEVAFPHGIYCMLIHANMRFIGHEGVGGKGWAQPLRPNKKHIFVTPEAGSAVRLSGPQRPVASARRHLGGEVRYLQLRQRHYHQQGQGLPAARGHPVPPHQPGRLLSRLRLR